MINNHIKAWTSLVIREMEIKTTKDTNPFLPELLKLKRLTKPSAGEDVEQLEILHIARGNVKVPATLANSWLLLIKLSICTHSMTQQVHP